MDIPASSAPSMPTSPAGAGGAPPARSQSSANLSCHKELIPIFESPFPIPIFNAPSSPPLLPPPPQSQTTSPPAPLAAAPIRPSPPAGHYPVPFPVPASSASHPSDRPAPPPTPPGTPCTLAQSHTTASNPPRGVSSRPSPRCSDLLRCLDWPPFHLSSPL